MNSNVPVPPSNGGGLSGDRVTRGTVARWSATTGWVDRDGLPLPDTMLVVGYTTVLRRWKDKKPEYITEQPLRDPKVLNDAIPVEEWEIGLDDNPTPPWKLTYVIYFVDLKTGALFTYAHDTYGAMLCFNNLEDAIGMMRLLRGEHVLPIVHLEKRQWKSRSTGCRRARICSRSNGVRQVAVVLSWHRNRRLRSSLDRLRLRLQPRRLQRLRLRLRQLNLRHQQRLRRLRLRLRRRFSTTRSRSSRSRSRNSSPTRSAVEVSTLLNSNGNDNDGRQIASRYLFGEATMATVYWDVETYSQISLTDRGAYIYAADPATGIFFFCYAIDDGEVQVWRPGDPVPEPFANPTGYKFVSDNWEFEHAIHASILVRRYGFPTLPIEQQDCAQRLALANAYPAELGLRCEALGLPYCKSPEARKAMLRLSRPQTAKKRKNAEDPAARERDLALLLERCKNDVRATRAAYNSPRLRPSTAGRTPLLLLDAEINARGICANVPFLEAAPHAR